MNKHILLFLVAAVTAQFVVMVLAMLFAEGRMNMNTLGEGWLEVMTVAAIAILGWREFIKLIKLYKTKGIKTT